MVAQKQVGRQSSCAVDFRLELSHSVLSVDDCSPGRSTWYAMFDGVSTASIDDLRLSTLMEKTDTDEKPFSCSICDQSFSRQDMKSRHMKTRHPDVPPQPEADDGTGVLRKRAKTACDRCRRMKVRCKCNESDRRDSGLATTPAQLAIDDLSIPTFVQEPQLDGSRPIFASDEPDFASFGLDLDLSGNPVDGLIDWVTTAEPCVVLPLAEPCQRASALF